MLRLEAAEDARSHDRASVWSRPPRYTQLFWDLAPSNPWLMIGPRPPAAHPSVSPPVPSKGRLAGWLAGWLGRWGIFPPLPFSCCVMRSQPRARSARLLGLLFLVSPPG